FGYDPDIAEHHARAPERSAFTEGLLQVAVGIPAYSALMLGAVFLVRSVVAARRRDGDAGAPRPPVASAAQAGPG
ncbi:MAG TPA: hypothetical protein VHG90_06865, partial [Acidimicrobiales bacterium]|nr:hypothetical protein [Acidimicrobiales bacterium]